MLDASPSPSCRAWGTTLPGSRGLAHPRFRHGPSRPCRIQTCQFSLLDRHVDGSGPSTSGTQPTGSAPSWGSPAQQQARAVLERLYHASGSFWTAPTCSPLDDPKQQGLCLVAVEPEGSILQVSLNEKPNKVKSPDYYANVGDAIRALREDIPQLFERELDYSFYRDDIVFRDPRNTFEGLKNYKLIFWSLRFHGRLFFSKLYVEVKRIWQPEDDIIRMRWTVHGVPRVPWEAEGIFDGISTYRLDSTGKIYEHAVDNVILRDPPMQGLGPLLAGLNLAPQQQPCPGAWFKDHQPAAAAASSSSSRSSSSSSTGSNRLPSGHQLAVGDLSGALLATVALQVTALSSPEQQLVTRTQE